VRSNPERSLAYFLVDGVVVATGGVTGAGAGATTTGAGAGAGAGAAAGAAGAAAAGAAAAGADDPDDEDEDELVSVVAAAAGAGVAVAGALARGVAPELGTTGLKVRVLAFAPAFAAESSVAWADNSKPATIAMRAAADATPVKVRARAAGW